RCPRDGAAWTRPGLASTPPRSWPRWASTPQGWQSWPRPPSSSRDRRTRSSDTEALGDCRQRRLSRPCQGRDCRQPPVSRAAYALAGTGDLGPDLLGLSPGLLGRTAVVDDVGRPVAL